MTNHTVPRREKTFRIGSIGLCSSYSRLDESRTRTEFLQAQPRYTRSGDNAVVRWVDETRLYELIPNTPEHRLTPLIEKFAEAVSGAGVFTFAIATSKSGDG
jgi:hypothetical protein